MPFVDFLCELSRVKRLLLSLLSRACHLLLYLSLMLLNDCKSLLADDELQLAFLKKRDLFLVYVTYHSTTERAPTGTAGLPLPLREGSPGWKLRASWRGCAASTRNDVTCAFHTPPRFWRDTSMTRAQHSPPTWLTPSMII